MGGRISEGEYMKRKEKLKLMFHHIDKATIISIQDALKEMTTFSYTIHHIESIIQRHNKVERLLCELEGRSDTIAFREEVGYL